MSETTESAEPGCNRDSLAGGAVDDLIGALKQPLTAIRAAADILRDNPDLPAELRDQFHAVLVRDGDRLNRLIDASFAGASVDGDRRRGDGRRISLPVPGDGEGTG